MSKLANIERYIGKFQTHPKLKAVLDKIGYPLMNLHRPTDFLRRLNLILKGNEYRTTFLDSIKVEKLAEWMQNPPLSNNIFEALQEMRLLPTPEILAYIESGKGGLQEIIQEIEGGGFTPTDELKLELEYSRFKLYGIIIKETKKMVKCTEPLEKFKEMPWIENDCVFLDEYEINICSKLAKESIEVFNLIKKSKSEVPTLVIANMRYGSNYVVSPIEDVLNEIGVDVVHEYIRSYCYTDRKVGKNYYDNSISHNTWELIAEKNPNIFVVDGTSFSESLDGNARFPGAMWGYIQSFQAYNGVCENKEANDWNFDCIKKLNPSKKYEIKFWHPTITKTIQVGDFIYDLDTVKGSRVLTIVSSVGNGSSDTSRARFDDPEDYLKNNTVTGFTSHGLDYRLIAKDGKSFVKAVQKEMKKKIRQTDRQI